MTQTVKQNKSKNNGEGILNLDFSRFKFQAWHIPVQTCNTFIVNNCQTISDVTFLEWRNLGLFFEKGNWLTKLWGNFLKVRKFQQYEASSSSLKWMNVSNIASISVYRQVCCTYWMRDIFDMCGSFFVTQSSSSRLRSHLAKAKVKL